VCVCVCVFCNAWVCVCLSFVIYGCFDNCVGVLVKFVQVFIVFLYGFVYVNLILFVTGVRTAATECKLNCSR
jgi:hypothetical protein